MDIEKMKMAVAMVGLIFYIALAGIIIFCLVKFLII